MLKRGLRVFGPALPLRAKASPDGWQSPFFPGRFHRWGRLQLSCCIYLQRLTDPAKGVSCSHREPGKRHLHNSPSQLPRNSLATLRVMRVRQRIQTNQRHKHYAPQVQLRPPRCIRCAAPALPCVRLRLAPLAQALNRARQEPACSPRGGSSHAAAQVGVGAR